VIYLALTIYAWLIVARTVLSWLQPRPGSAVFRAYRVLFDVTEPYLALFRRLLPDGSHRRGRHRLQPRGAAARPVHRDPDPPAPV